MKIAFLRILLLILAAAAFAVSASAQERGKIASGSYDSLMLAVNAQGELTGYFDEGTGDDGHGHPRFTCTFFIYGEKQVGNAYKVSTWYPGVAEDEVITGTLKLVGKGAQAKVNLHLDGEHGGCWNVAPGLKERAGVDFELDSPATWEAIRIISPAKSYFFISPEAKAPQKIFVVKNDPVRVLSLKGEWAEVSYAGESGKTTQGWMKLSEFFPVKPPGK